MKNIYSGINATGHSLWIPMPGRRIPPTALSLVPPFRSRNSLLMNTMPRSCSWIRESVNGRQQPSEPRIGRSFSTLHWDCLVMRHGVRAYSSSDAGTPSRTLLLPRYCSSLRYEHIHQARSSIHHSRRTPRVHSSASSRV